jgi:hypothetical protein
LKHQLKKERGAHTDTKFRLKVSHFFVSLAFHNIATIDSFRSPHLFVL